MIRRLGAIVAVALLLGGAIVSAHPTASTFVVVRVPGDGTVEVQITANARALALTLAGLAELPQPPSATANDRDRIVTSTADLIRLTEVEADGRRVALRWLGVAPVDERPEAITVHLAGELPPGASTLRWRARYLLGAYPLAVVGASAMTDSDAYDWLAGHEQSRRYQLDALATAESAWRKGARLVGTGFTHILPGGLDHVLFVLGLFLLASGPRALLLQISAFTVAHSLTLALGVLGFVRLPDHIVEPLIAASIVFIAVENLVRASLSRWRVMVVFAFGLLHGLGFAGAMADLGLSGTHLVASLVGFNVGVELGQLAVIGLAALSLYALRLPAETERRFVSQPASVAIAMTGLVWALERLRS